MSKSKIRPMTVRQKKFCEFYATNGGNGAKAARDAGYNGTNHREIAKQNMQNKRIIAYLEKLTKENDNERIANRNERQEFWTKMMRGEIPDSEMKDRLRASELLGKSQADFVERKEHAGFGGTPLDVGIKVVFDE